MYYFDLHCDTVTECMMKGKSLLHNDLHIDMTRGAALGHYIQCFAAWIPDTLRGEAAFQHFIKIADCLEQERRAYSNKMQCHRMPETGEGIHQDSTVTAILTVENGAALGGTLETIPELRRRGVKLLTLTWNGENELGRGVMAPGKGGLTEFGRNAVRMLEDAGIIVDVSHASPELFEDVASIAKKPFIATHSNSIQLCRHPRNLSDQQFLAIKASGGIVGLNFYRGFLNDTPDKASMMDILRHAEHFLSLGGEDVLAMGSDFDGASLPSDMEGIQSVPRLWELFLRHNYKESLLYKIFYQNAAEFFIKNKLF